MALDDPERGAAIRRLPAPLAAGLVPAVVAAAVSANTLLNGFVYDDTLVFGQLDGWWTRGLEGAFSSKPLTYAVHTGDHWLWGDWAPGFHLTNAVLHAIAAFLSAYAATLLTGSTRSGFICGLLFAVHPVHMESVASFANRGEILVMIFTCLSLLLWLDPQRRASRYTGSLVCIALAFAAGEVATAGVIPMLFVADLLVRRDDGSFRRRLRRAALRSAPLWLLTALWTYGLAGDVSRYFEASSIYHETEGIAAGYAEVLATSAAAVPDLFRLLFFPVGLSADYPVRAQSGFGETRALIGIAVLLVWIAAALALSRRAPRATFAMAWVIATYLPWSNVIPFTNYFVAERFLYVPSFGACLLVALGLDAAFGIAQQQRRSVLKWSLVAGLSLGTLAAGARSVLRNRDWQSPEALATSALASGMDTWRMRRMLAQVNSQNGDYALASFNLQRAVELAPLFPELQYEFATALLYAGRMIEAAEQMDLVSLRTPSGSWAATAHQNLGVALALQKLPEAAIDQYRLALELEPDHADAHHNLAVALASQGDLSEAIRHYRRVLELQPERPDAHHNLGIALVARGELDEAIRHYRRALEPMPERAGVHRDLGTALALQDRQEEAIEQYRRALEQSPRDGDAHHNLAVALANRGELEEAIRHYREALVLDPERTDAQRNLGLAVALQDQRNAASPEPLPDGASEPGGADEERERETAR